MNRDDFDFIASRIDRMELTVASAISKVISCLVEDILKRAFLLYILTTKIDRQIVWSFGKYGNKQNTKATRNRQAFGCMYIYSMRIL